MPGKQVFYLVSPDKREYVDPHYLGLDSSLRHGSSDRRTVGYHIGDVLFDLVTADPFSAANTNPLIGRWAGHKVVIAGDEITTCRRGVNGAALHAEALDDYTNISRDILQYTRALTPGERFVVNLRTAEYFDPYALGLTADLGDDVAVDVAGETLSERLSKVLCQLFLSVSVNAEIYAPLIGAWTGDAVVVVGDEDRNAGLINPSVIYRNCLAGRYVDIAPKLWPAVESWFGLNRS